MAESGTFDTSSYPRPRAPDNPLDSIVKVGQVADQLGNIEVGKAMQQAIQPDGSVDRNALAGILKQSTVGAMKALPALDALEKLRQAGYAADQSGLETFQKRMAITSHLFSGVASKDKPSINDIYDIAAKAMDPGLEGKKYGITLPVVMNAVKSFFGPDGKPLPPEAIRKKALEIQTQAASTAEVLQQHTPQVRLVDTGQGYEFQPGGTPQNPAYTATPKQIPPTQPVIGPNNTPQLFGQQPQPLGGTARPIRQATEGITGIERGPVTNAQTGEPIASFNQRFDASFPRGPQVGLAPGVAGSLESEAASNAAGANALTTAANEIPATKAILNNLEEDLNKFTSGQGADWSRIATNFANRNLPVPKSWKEEGGFLDEKSLASQEGFNKLAQQLAQVQFQALGGTGTDAKLNSAMSTSPNEYLSKLGNKGIIRLLKGNQDALEAKNKAWLEWRKAGNGPNTFNEFSSDFNNHFDPRVFQFKYIPAKERQAYFNRMDEDERQKFLVDMTYARKQGWVKFDQPKEK